MNTKFNKNRYSISLCICTFNRPNELQKCLSSVFQCSEKPEEIIVSDDSPDNKSNLEVIKDYPGVIYQRGPQRGLAPNRNSCIRRASCSHLIFIDDDVCVPSEFFSIAKELIVSSQPNNIITGYEMNHGGGGKWEGEVRKIVPSNSDFWGFQRITVQQEYLSIVINSTIFPRQLFEQALFDENLRYGSEEIDIARHSTSLNYQIVYEDKLYVEHYPSSINRQFYKQFIDASRLYATTKSYWQYEKDFRKTLAYILLAPLHLLVSKIKRLDLYGLFRALKSIILAIYYFSNSSIISPSKVIHNPIK
ncbi:MAG: glycosyltransferase family 2 protein [Xenococcaceae cyanobacterium MO_207.B15]|nr:glycosyltransferase family 2 protein [Xenococcaceae cyanobacterium MO_207.B15]